MAKPRIRAARADEAGALTQLAIRATRHDGYDADAIARFMPALEVTPALLGASLLLSAETEDGVLAGVVGLSPTGLPGLLLLERIFVDPPVQRQRIGQTLFRATIAAAQKLGGCAILIYASPTAQAFYERMGANQIGSTPFVYSPELHLPMMLFVIPPAATGI